MAGVAGLAIELAELTIEELEELEAIDAEVYGEEYETAAEAEAELPESIQFAIREPFFRRPPLREVVRGAPAAGIIAEGIALPAQVRYYGKKWWGKKPSQSKMRRRISTGPKRATRGNHTSFFDFWSERTMPMTGKRKRTILRSRRRRPYPRMVRPRTTGAYTRASTIATSSKHRGKIAVIKKLMRGVTPTLQETGGSLTHILSNPNLKTTPDGQGAFSWAFQLDQFPNYADYTDVYQWYKILGVKIHFYPLNNGYPAVNRSSATYPAINRSVDGTGVSTSGATQLILAPDHQTQALFATETEAMSHAGAIHHVFNDSNELTMYVAPKPTGLLGPAGSEVVYEVPNTHWITTNTVNLPHFGVRGYMVAYDASSIKVVMEMKVAFKQQKV